MAGALLAAAVEHAFAHGATVVEGYPVDPARRPKAGPADLYHGTLGLFLAAGFTVVAQDLFVGASLRPFLEQVDVRPLSLIMLAPDVSTVMQRESERVKTGYGDLWSIRDFDRKVRSETPHIGLWLDSSQQTPDETVDELIRRLPEARID